MYTRQLISITWNLSRSSFAFMKQLMTESYLLISPFNCLLLFIVITRNCRWFISAMKKVFFHSSYELLRSALKRRLSRNVSTLMPSMAVADGFQITNRWASIKREKKKKANVISMPEDFVHGKAFYRHDLHLFSFPLYTSLRYIEKGGKHCRRYSHKVFISTLSS